MPDDPKKPSEREKELRDVLRQERARGKRHVDPEAEEERRKIKKQVSELLIECDDEEIFGRTLISLGVVEPGTASYEQALSAWRDFRKQRASQHPRRL